MPSTRCKYIENRPITQVDCEYCIGHCVASEAKRQGLWFNKDSKPLALALIAKHQHVKFLFNHYDGLVSDKLCLLLKAKRSLPPYWKISPILRCVRSLLPPPPSPWSCCKAIRSGCDEYKILIRTNIRICLYPKNDTNEYPNIFVLKRRYK